MKFTEYLGPLSTAAMDKSRTLAVLKKSGLNPDTAETLVNNGNYALAEVHIDQHYWYASNKHCDVLRAFYTVYYHIIELAETEFCPEDGQEVILAMEDAIFSSISLRIRLARRVADKLTDEDKETIATHSDVINEIHEKTHDLVRSVKLIGISERVKLINTKRV